jgi:hypothetical protein
MRILCDQMVKERFVSVLDSEPPYGRQAPRPPRPPDAADDTIAAYAAQHDWVFLTADDDYVADEVPYGLLLYEDHPVPTAGEVRNAIREIERVYDDTAAIREWVPDGWVS